MPYYKDNKSHELHHIPNIHILILMEVINQIHKYTIKLV